MVDDHTQQQNKIDVERSKQLSLRQTKPPADIPGYCAERFIGSGAYGEVWVCVDQNTGRRVAVKFYTHGSSADWSLLSREVEKLAVLSADRYVVQLLDVGWDATPPYYVMDYIENGSLEDALKRRGTLPPAEAVEIFEEVAIGLMHLHSKGVLHCDLKPANVLLDEDHKPRLADFGQSRLSHEQVPAFGTLFYMAPEQADVQSLPDAGWDVYALGALLFRMLTGNAPHRTSGAVKQLESASQFSERLAQYRTMIQTKLPPIQHRQIPGVDGALADIIDRCLAPNPEARFASVESVLAALRRREEARARRPLMMLGFVAPLVLLFIMSLFGIRGYHAATEDSVSMVTHRVQESNRYHAEAVAANVAAEIERYFHAIERVTDDPDFQTRFEAAVEDLDELSRALSDPALKEPNADLLTEFLQDPARLKLQQYIERLMSDASLPLAASWITSDARGVHMADDFNEKPTNSPLGKNFGWRTYFTGRERDEATSWRPGSDDHITDTNLSPVFQSTATLTWKVAISRPVVVNGRFLGVVGLTVEMGQFRRTFLVGRGKKEADIERSQIAVADTAPVRHTILVAAEVEAGRGVILQHPLFDEVLRRRHHLPIEFSDPRFQVPLEQLEHSDSPAPVERYRDPMQGATGGEAFRRDWIAATAPVTLASTRDGAEGRHAAQNTGLIVLVQEDYEAAIAPVHQLGERLMREGALALTVIMLVVLVLWYFVARMIVQPRPAAVAATDESATPALHTDETLTAPR